MSFVRVSCILDSFLFSAVNQSLVGESNIELAVFDILKEKVSLHQPLFRFVSGLLAGLSQFNLDISRIIHTSSSVSCCLPS